MASPVIKLFNGARMTTATTGTGTVTLGSAVTGYLSFSASGIADGDRVYYSITEGANLEVGIGTYTASGTTLSRDTILNSTAGAGTPITLAGNAQVAITATAESFNDRQFGGYFTGLYYYGSIPGAPATMNVVSNVYYFMPFTARKRNTWTEIGMQVTTLEAASQIQCAIYADSNGVPTGSPLAVSGTLSGATTGNKTATISLDLYEGFYHMALLAANTGTLAILAYEELAANFLSGKSDPAIVPHELMYAGAGSIGSWPTNPSISRTGLQNIPCVWFRF